MPIGFVGPALQGASLISKFGIPLLQQAGIGASLAGIGVLADAASKTRSNVPGRNRRANVGSNKYSGIIGSIPPSANGESYRDAELRLGNRGGSGGNAGYSTSTGAPQGTFSPAAERDYQQKVSRVAQLTAQDPELQRYEEARKKAKLAGPGSAAEQSAEDIGMQIWAQKYGKTLAPKVKPGQAGYDVIQNTLAGNAARAGAGFKLPDQLVPTPAGFPTAVPAFTQTAPGGYDRGFGITTNLAPGATLQPFQPTPTAMPAASPTFNLGAAFGQPGVLDEETLKRFSDILLQSAK
jgi:hypothetical protein